MLACLSGLFLDHHRQETLPSYSLVGCVMGTVAGA